MDSVSNDELAFCDPNEIKTIQNVLEECRIYGHQELTFSWQLNSCLEEPIERVSVTPWWTGILSWRGPASCAPLAGIGSRFGMMLHRIRRYGNWMDTTVKINGDIWDKTLNRENQRQGDTFMPFIFDMRPSSRSIPHPPSLLDFMFLHYLLCFYPFQSF